MKALRSLTVLAVAALAVAFSSPAKAQDDLEALLDSNVVTTASQTAETSDVAPAISTNITAEQLRRYGIHTLEEAVNYLSLAVSSGGRNFHAQPVDLGARGVLIAGDRGNHVLLLINGHHVNEPGLGTANFGYLSGIPMEMVDHIEVIVGPGSVLYGSNAMLGVVNVITKRASGFDGGLVYAEAGLIDSARTGAGFGHEFSLFGSDAEITAMGQYFQRWGPDLEVGPQNRGIDFLTGEPFLTNRGGERNGIWGGTLTKEGNFIRSPSGHVRFKVGNLTVNAHARYSEIGLPLGDRTIGGDFDSSRNRSYERTFWVDIAYSTVLSPIVDLTARAYADTWGQETQTDVIAGPCGVLTECVDRGVQISRWAGAELQTSFDWLKDGTLVTLLGADGRIRNFGSKQDLLDPTGSEPLEMSRGVLNLTDGTLGVYFQQVARPLPWLGFNAGARVDADPRFDPVLSPRFATTIGLWKGATLRGVYSHAFRAPGRFETEATVFEQVRPDLDPETVQSIEGSLEQQIGTHRFLLGGFYSRWQGLVRRVDLTDEERADLFQGLEAFLPEGVVIDQLRNTGDIENYGLNASYSGTALDSRLEWGVNATLSKSREKTEGTNERDLPVAPTLFGNARLSYDLDNGLPTVGVVASYLNRRPSDVAFTGEFTPQPFAEEQIDLRGTLSGPVPGVAGLSYRLSAGYITAKRGPYVVGPIRSATSDQTSAELNPLDQFQAFIGLQYDFPR